MNDTAKSNIKLVITEDDMEVRLYLNSTSEYLGVDHTVEYTYENLVSYLKEQGIVSGIDETLLQSICINRLFDRYHTVAKGSYAVDGTDGYYTYFFKQEIDNKPKVLEDGSIDYHTVDIFEPVSQGMLVAEYTPATAGHFGYTIKGQLLTCTPGKDLSPLKGSGFTVSEDKKQYFSDLNGKIELKNDTLVITNVLDINGDVDLTTGDIQFNGDLIIHGNVSTGSLIKVTGTLTIMGNVEGAYISAGGDIQLKSGMQGSGRGVIECNGDVWGKFFEQTTLRVKGNINANSMMNCDVICDGSIKLSGKHGIVVGGTVSCRGTIDSMVIGNLAEMRTNIYAGVNEQLLNELRELEEAIAEINDKQTKHSQILEKLESIKNPTEVDKLQTMIGQVKASIGELDSRLTEYNDKLQQKLFLISSCSEARIIARSYLYPHVNIILNGLHYTTADTFKNVTMKVASGEIKIVSNI